MGVKCCAIALGGLAPISGACQSTLLRAPRAASARQHWHPGVTHVAAFMLAMSTEAGNSGTHMV